MQQVIEALERAKTLLDATMRFITSNPISEYEVFYDGALCDGYCLVDDCKVAIADIDDALASLRLKEAK